MPNYPLMYRKLVAAQADVIEGLQYITQQMIQLHQKMEELYIENPDAELSYFPADDSSQK